MHLRPRQALCARGGPALWLAVRHSLLPPNLCHALGLPSVQQAVYAAALSQLGLILGTTERGRDFYSLYIEPAFLDTENVRGRGRVNLLLLPLLRAEA